MNNKQAKFTLLTFYKFVDLEAPHKYVRDQKSFCTDIGMRGRVYISEEGISATLSGNAGQIKAYKLYLDSIPAFRDIPDIEAKAMKVDSHYFDKMIVRYRKEIVALGESYSAREIEENRHLISVADFKSIMDNDNDAYVILDMRNNYEYDLGHFKNALPAGTNYFRELDELIDHYKKRYSGKSIITYCTGGIRCEKAAVKLKRSGIKDVYQLDGGIVKYVNTYNDGNWLGNLYTFDGRVSCEVVQGENHTIISKCHYTGEPAESYFNCRYGFCNKQFIAQPKQYRKHFGFCSEECAEKAMHDLMIRYDDFDSMDYKSLRGRIKQTPEAREQIAEEIRSHVRKHLAGIEFPVQQPKPNELLFV